MSGKENGQQPSIALNVSTEDVDVLRRVANHYLSMRPLRSLIALTGPGEIRARYRFIRDESKLLQRFASTTLHSMRAAGEKERAVRFTARALVAYWGRLLASLNTPRSRRKLSVAEIERRERVSAILQSGLRSLLPRHRALILAELRTRRPAEEAWMRSDLGLPPPPDVTPPTEQEV